MERIITMINKTFPANFIKIRVGEDLFHFWWCPSRRQNFKKYLPQLGCWWNLQERFRLSLWWSSPNFKMIALLKQILVFSLNKGNSEFWECWGRVFFSSRDPIFGCKCFTLLMLTLSTPAPNLVLTLVFYHRGLYRAGAL